MLRDALLVLGQQAAWFACALSADAGRPGVGLAVTTALLLLHLATSPARGRDAVLLACAGLLGAVGDGVLVAAGLLSFPAHARLGPLPAPLWMASLWAALAALLPGPLAWLTRDLRLAAAVGAVAGPLAYRGGAALGALAVHDAAGLTGVAALYALATPLLAALARAGPGSLLDRALDASIVRSFDRHGFTRHSRGFDPRDLDVRLEGKVVLVTGANSGIGYAAALGLARLGASVRLVCRDPGRGRAALEALETETGGRDLRLDVLDVTDQDAVRRYAETLPDEAVDVLVHNAGVLPDTRDLTPDGLERTFATHVAGPYLLTTLLEPRLRRRPGARVIFVSSGGMYGARLSLDDVDWSRRPWDGVAAYAQTKRMQVVLADLLAERWRAAGVAVHAMHPGWADTPAVRSSLPRFWRLMRRVLRTPAEGADTVVWLAAVEPARPTGGFWFDRRRRAAHLLPWTREAPPERERLLEACQAATRSDA